MHQAIVVFKVPFDCAEALACPLMPLTFRSTRCGGSIESFLLLVMHTEAPSSSIRAYESESNVLGDAILLFAHVVVIPERVVLIMGLPCLRR